MKKNDSGLRDVTAEVDAALSVAKTEGSAWSFWGMVSYIPFILNVYHRRPWDIKYRDQWEDTIGTSFPGYDVVVLYRGKEMTPADIGNFTYGSLGNSYGYSLGELYMGSYIAAGGLMMGSDDFNHEVTTDWMFITYGYLDCDFRQN